MKYQYEMPSVSSSRKYSRRIQMLKFRRILRMFIKILKYGVIAFAAFLVLYFAALRNWNHTWGASDLDVSRHMPGDELLEDPGFNTNRAVVIKAQPKDIWPWLVQMGYRRAGLYSFDRFDNGGIPSSEIILHEFQDLKVRDLIPLGPGNDYGLRVVSMDPYNTMCWVFEVGPWDGATWSWGIYKIDEEHTKLVSRLRANWVVGHPMDILGIAFVDAFEIIMMRKCLLGIKRRAEAGILNPG